MAHKNEEGPHRFGEALLQVSLISLSVYLESYLTKRPINITTTRSAYCGAGCGDDDCSVHEVVHRVKYSLVFFKKQGGL
jgi:hypothetical protein